MTTSNKTYQTLNMKLGGTHADQYIGDQGELFYDPESITLRIGDGLTPGGSIVGGVPDDTTLNYTSASSTTGSIIAKTGSSAVAVAHNAAFVVDNFSGMLLVNDHYDGGVALYIAGGGYSKLVSNTRTAFANTLPMQDNGYKWINSTNLTGPFTFTVIDTRGSN